MNFSKITVFIMFLLTVSLLFSEEYGKIAGRVVDENDKPIIGADVMIEGTELGAATDENGLYMIPYVAAGTHTVTASYIGYNFLTYSNVIVNHAQTTICNFRLQPTVIILDAHDGPSFSIHLYEAQNISVFREHLYMNYINHLSIKHLPFTTIEELLAYQSSTAKTDSGIHFRGGRNNEITYYVDKVETKVPNFGWQSTHISPQAIDEISIINGGFNAEYGNALSRIVNITTKQGSRRHRVNIHYLTDEIFSGDKLNFGYNQYNLSLEGPVTRRLRYFVAGEVMLTDAYQEALYNVSSPRMDYRMVAKLHYLFPMAKGKITISGHKSREQYMIWQPFHPDADLVYLFDKPMSRSKNWIVSVACQYMLTPKTLSSLNFSLTHFDRVFGSRDCEWEEENNRKCFEDYRIKKEYLIDYLLAGENPRIILGDSLILYDALDTVNPFRNDPYGVKGLFTYVTDYPTWSFWYNNDIQLRGDITHAFSIIPIPMFHEIKTGFDIVKYDIRYYNRESPPLSERLYGVRYYKRNPYKIAGFIQDKIDLEGIIAQPGIRFDYFDANVFTYTNPSIFFDDTLSFFDPVFTASPRLGISLPVSTNMRFRLNYGHYYQIPPFDYMYHTTDTSIIRLILSQGDTILSNIFIKPEKLVAYEFGLEKIFFRNTLFSATAYYKDYDNLVQLRKVRALPNYYYQYFNDGHHRVKGIELIIRKSPANMWACGIAYTLQYANGASSWAHEKYYASEIEPPVVDYWLDHDERHNFVAHLELEIPKDFKIFYLQNFASSFVFSYHSGHPYTPIDLDDKRLGDVNSERMPGYWNVDWKLSRGIHVGSTKLVLACLINNLFNTKQVVRVYNTTGLPDEHGDLEPKLGQFDFIAIGSSYYSPQADYNHDGLITPMEMKTAYITARSDYYSDPTHYNSPFRIRLGIDIGF
jgi:hypothetical protein